MAGGDQIGACTRPERVLRDPCLCSVWALGVALAFAVILGFHTMKIAGAACTGG